MNADKRIDLTGRSPFNRGMRQAAAAILAAFLACGAGADDYVDVVVSTTDFGLGKLVLHIFG